MSMNKTIKYTLVLGLVTTMTAGLGTPVRAEDNTAPTPPPTPAPAVTPAPATPVVAANPVVISGKIVVVDKIARTITVNVNGKLKLLKVGAKVKVVDNGKMVRFEDLSAGQNIAVLTRENADGTMEVVALSVEPQGALEAAGRDKTKPKSNNGRSGGTPFQNTPNPANNGGPIISPSN